MARRKVKFLFEVDPQEGEPIDDLSMDITVEEGIIPNLMTKLQTLMNQHNVDDLPPEEGTTDD